jgi:hypothetical protein
MNALWIFFIIVLFCMYVLIGLHITDGSDSFIKTFLTWIIYTVMCSTFVNVFLLGYFWSVVHNKRGPTGLRGPIGERGPIGLEGKCSLDLVEAYLIKELMQYIDDLYFAQTNKHILNETTYTIPCTYVNNKIAVMAGSKQYKTIYKNLYINSNPTLYNRENFNTDTQQTDTKPIQSIISYLKKIWKEWFNLIYSATSTPGEWFNDPTPDADESYKWVGANPFLEIRKYDIYYWGITRNFRPLKAEICRTSPDNVNSKFPIINQILQPRLKIIKTNDYYQVGDSRNTNNNQDASVWSPNSVSINTDTYYPVGDLFFIGKNNPTKAETDNTIVGNDKPGQPGIMTYNNSDANGKNGPNMSTILVAGDVVDPVDTKEMVDFHSKNHLSAYKLVCPSGYTALGDVGRADEECKNLNDNNKITSPCTNFNTFKCVPTDCVEEVSPGVKSEEKKDNNQWNRYNKWYNGMKARWSWTWYDNINTLNNSKLNDRGVDPLMDSSTGYNLFRAPSGKATSEPFYKIKDSCLAPPTYKKAKTKPLETKYDDLGIGWYGHPYKLEPKYSIFSFLGLAPEGLIVHSGTGRRYYVIQYGGEEADIYIVLIENDSGDYKKAIQTDSNPSNTGTNIRNISKSDTRQQWRIVLQPNDKKHFTMTNISNNRQLNIDLEPRLGNAVHTTITGGDSDNYLFTFIPAFGTHLNNVE